MDYLELIIGSAIGFSLDKLFKTTPRVLQNIKNRRINQQPFSSPEFIRLDNGNPLYKTDNIIHCLAKKKFILPIPEEYVQVFRQKYPDFEIRNQESGDSLLCLQKGLEQYPGFANLQLHSETLIQSCLQETATAFLTTLDKGAIRFNGYKYGIKKIRGGRHSLASPDNNLAEDSVVFIEEYITDYFTFKTVACLTRKLKEAGYRFKIEVLEDVNNYPYAFNSFGVLTLVVFNRGLGDEVLFTIRSKGAASEHNKLHVSMNEGFSLLDTDEEDKPSFTTCLFRGLKEELGIRKNQVELFGFTNIGLVNSSTRLELCINSFARLKRLSTSSGFTFYDLITAYQNAQDSSLEISELKTIRVKELKNFIKENATRFTPDGLASFSTFLNKYKQNQCYQGDPTE